MHQKQQSSETETYNRSHAPPLILVLIFKQMPCSFHTAGKNTNYMLRLQNTVYVISFLQETEEKNMKPEPAKKQSPLN
jgi:hypothetical protein